MSKGLTRSLNDHVEFFRYTSIKTSIWFLHVNILCGTHNCHSWLRRNARNWKTLSLRTSWLPEWNGTLGSLSFSPRNFLFGNSVKFVFKHRRFYLPDVPSDSSRLSNNALYLKASEYYHADRWKFRNFFGLGPLQILSCSRTSESRRMQSNEYLK